MDGPPDVIGVRFDKVFKCECVEEFWVFFSVCVFLDMENDICSVGILLTFRDGISVDTVAVPFVCNLWTVGFGDYGDFIGDHERWVESYTELTDDVTVSILFQSGFEIEGSAVCDDTEVLIHLLIVHSDSVIGYGDCTCVIIGWHLNLEISSWNIYFGIRNRLVVHFVDCVRCVGNEFSEEDFFVSVNWIDHKIQKTFWFSLEFSFSHDIPLNYQLLLFRILEC